MVSEDPFKWIFALRERFPELFEPEAVVKQWTPEKIKNAFIDVSTSILNGNGVGETGAGALSYKADEHSNAWHKNSIALAKYWGGDLRNVFWGVTDFEEAFRRVDYHKNKSGFKGMRRKIFSLLVIWLQDRNLIPVFPAAIPIDFHALRILWATEILEIKTDFSVNGRHPAQLKGKKIVRISERFIDIVAKWSQKFIAENGFSHLNVNPAVWVLSRTLCAGHFQNSSRRGFFVETDILTKRKLWPKTYKDPCVHCPIETYCEWAIPSMPYYRWGLLARLGRRVGFPVLPLPLGDDFLPPYKARKERKN